MCGRYLVDEEVYADMWILMNTLDTSPAAVPGTAAAAPAAIPGTAATDPNISAAGAQNLAIGEVFPTNIAPVISVDDISAGLKALGCKWGFPHWKGSGVIINARAETALEKKMFRAPLLSRRCVIPSAGFYEWSRAGGGKKKDKYLLRLPEKRLLFMAGMINLFPDENGEMYGAFVVLTTTANPSVSPIHDRMPVILAEDEKINWLRDEDFMEYALYRPGPELIADIC